MTRLELEVFAAEFAAAYGHDLVLPTVEASFEHGWNDQRGAVTFFRGPTSDLDAYNAGRLAWLIFEGMRP